MRCEQEMCDLWTGDSLCVCAVQEGDPDAIEAMDDWLNEQTDSTDLGT